LNTSILPISSELANTKIRIILKIILRLSKKNPFHEKLCHIRIKLFKNMFFIQSVSWCRQKGKNISWICLERNELFTIWILFSLFTKLMSTHIIWKNRLHTMIYEQLLFIIAERFDVWKDVGFAMMRTKINIRLDGHGKRILEFYIRIDKYILYINTSRTKVK